MAILQPTPLLGAPRIVELNPLTDARVARMNVAQSLFPALLKMFRSSKVSDPLQLARILGPPVYLRSRPHRPVVVPRELVRTLPLPIRVIVPPKALHPASVIWPSARRGPLIQM